MTIQKKAIEQYFKAGVSIIVDKVVQLFRLCIQPQCVAIQMKAIKQYFHVVLFVV